MPDVEITQSGRGGTVLYREGEHGIPFYWEFAMSPAVALLFSTPARGWDASYPWAAGRMQEIWDFVGEEIVRQQVSGGSFESDLDAGTMTVYERRTSRGYGWKPRVGDATKHMPRYERDEMVPETPAGSGGPPPPTEEDLAAALRDHISVERRLAAAEEMHRRDPSFDLDERLAREIRELHQPTDGLERALRLAAAHDSPTVRQALLYASYNGTECAPHCARLLQRLVGLPEPHDVTGLGLHVSYSDRTAGFAALCERVGMTLEV